MLPPVCTCQKCLPVLPSSATRLPSRTAAKTTPHRLAGLRIERLDACRRRRLSRFRCGRSIGRVRSSDVLATGFIRNISADVLLSVLRVREVHPAGGRAVGRRLEVGGAADRRIDEEAADAARVRFRNMARASVGVEPGIPVRVDERRARQELPVRAIRAGRSARCGQHGAAAGFMAIEGRRLRMGEYRRSGAGEPAAGGSAVRRSTRLDSGRVRRPRRVWH
jgi:hypothetical protein